MIKSLFVLAIIVLGTASASKVQRCISSVKTYRNDLNTLDSSIQTHNKIAVEISSEIIREDAISLNNSCTFSKKEVNELGDIIDDLIDCLQNVKPLYDDIKIIVNDAKAKNIDDLVDHIPEAFHNAEKAYNACKKLIPKKLN